MAHYRSRSEGRLPLYPSKQDTRFFRSLRDGPQPDETPHANPSEPHPIVRISATITNIIAYIPRRLYCRLKYHSRNGCDGIKGAHSVVSPRFRQEPRTTSAGVPEDERVSSGGTGTVVAPSTSSAYSNNYAVSVVPPASDIPNTMPDSTANEINRTLTRSARSFANNITQDFRHRLANDFLVGIVHSLDEYIRMGEFASLEEMLWERKEEQMRREREQWRSDTGFWSGWMG
ncbi:hypothetical protein N7G274_009287 [Stereocaulon virgatum]|uniref:Uncharacterized protein n=1 Tax=Stereocaulon virgatum TaxID=373712 RepID=A0ABR3ZWP1_9LECA